VYGLFLCLPARIRTWDPLIKSQLLYQLSYGEGIAGAKVGSSLERIIVMGNILPLPEKAQGMRQEAIRKRKNPKGKS
jgi:hypothetical protein